MWRRKPQRPPPTYEDVRLVAEVLSHINADLIQRHFSIPDDTATEYMTRLVADNLYGDVQADGWHYPKKYQKRLRQPRPTCRSVEKSKTADRVAKDATALPETAYVVELEEEVWALKARIKRLQNAGKTVIDQREEWKARSLAAENEVKRLAAELSSRPSVKPNNRFDVLRRIIARELHPDFCTGGHLEKMMRQECSKKLWPQIEQLAERR